MLHSCACSLQAPRQASYCGPLACLVGSVLLPQALLEVGNDALVGTLVIVALHSLDSCLVHCLQRGKDTKRCQRRIARQSVCRTMHLATETVR